MVNAEHHESIERELRVSHVTQSASNAKLWRNANAPSLEPTFRLLRRSCVAGPNTLVRVAKSGGVTVVVMVKCSKPSHGCARVYAIGTTPQGTEYARALCSTCFSRWERGQLRANLRVVRISLFGYR